MLHILRTVGATIVPLHQPVASVVVSQLSKLHGHSHNGCKALFTFVVIYFHTLQSVT